MTVTYSQPIRIDALAFRLPFSSDETTPVPFRVYDQGRLVKSFSSPNGTGEYIATVGDGESPFIEVLDRDCEQPAIAFPGRLTVNWLAITGATSYRVEELVSAVWTARQTILDTGVGAYSWLSRWLEDVTAHQFRVIAIDAAANEGTALAFTATMVRHPDAPNVTYTYNGSGQPDVTIASA